MTLKLRIETDTDPTSPREWDHDDVMVCFHRRYRLGDKHSYTLEDFENWDELRQHLISDAGAKTILPLYLHDHGGLSMSTGSFNDPWDSGMVGFIYSTRENDEKVLQSEVGVYDQFLRGDVWCVVIEDEQGEVLESLGGIYGHAYAKEEGEILLRHCEDVVAMQHKRYNEYVATALVESVLRHLKSSEGQGWTTDQLAQHIGNNIAQGLPALQDEARTRARAAKG